MDDFKQLMAQAVDAATQGDVQALLMAQMLLSHLRTLAFQRADPRPVHPQPF